MPIMQKITILGLAVAMSMMSCIVPVAEAEPIPSPYQQARGGAPIGEIVCAGDRMLMLSPSGMPACVFAGSVEVLERRGFVLLSEVPRDDLSAKQPGASEKAGETGSPDASKTGDRPFVTTWRTASPDESITIPVGSSTGAYTVDWGDGTATSVTGDASHVYASPGEYQVVISGDFTRIYLNGRPNAEKLQSIDQWGDIQWESMSSAFGGATNMAYRANDAPNLSNVTDMSKMFLHADSFNGDLSDWDVSGVRNMSCMFAGATSFNGDLSAWDVSNVQNMSCMFAAIIFSNAEVFSEHFVYAPSISFNGDLSDWDVSRVTDMSGMFAGAASFDVDLSAWDVSGVTDMSGMFAGATSFDGDISDWDVSKVRNMSCMFFGAPSFDGDISAWNVSEVRNMSCMFTSASSFNGDLSTWDVSSVNDMSRMFWNSRSFNSNLSDWNVSGVSDMYGAFSRASSFDGDISGWDVSKVADMTEMFYEASSFDGDISAWNVSSVTDMSHMFDGATSFDGDISAWDVSGVTDMIGMFARASSFDGDLSAWNVSNVDDMRYVFSEATSFNGNLSAWDVSSVNNMHSMFSEATYFNGDISDWDVSSVTGMSSMFSEATFFNGNLSAWDVSSVTNMRWMFAYALSFNGNLSSWDVSKVNNMDEMFTHFNQNLGPWYITLDNNSIDIGNGTGVTGNIATQNSFLGRQDITYEIGFGGDSALFEIDADALKIKPSADYSDKTEYVVTVTSTGGFGRDNFRVINVTVTGADDIRSKQIHADAAAFIATWRTTSPNESITIPVGGATGTYTVDWGDGSTSANVTGDQSHAYEDAGTYTVAITGNFERIYLNGDLINAPKLQSIEQWGNIKWISMGSAFEGARSMIYNADDIPDLSDVTHMYLMFYDAKSFNGNIPDWDV